jgi:hypothetical protein
MTQKLSSNWSSREDVRKMNEHSAKLLRLRREGRHVEAATSERRYQELMQRFGGRR